LIFCNIWSDLTWRVGLRTVADDNSLIGPVRNRPFPDNDLQRTLTGLMALVAMNFFLQSEVRLAGEQHVVLLKSRMAILKLDAPSFTHCPC
jgi:hypothetical protein